MRDTFDPPAKIVPAKVILNLCYDWSIDITKKLRQGFGKKKGLRRKSIFWDMHFKLNHFQLNLVPF